MRALQIIDAIAARASADIPDALAADLLGADYVLADPQPTNLLAGLAAAARALAEQTYLDAYDGYTSGKIGDDFDAYGHFDAVMTNFHNRMLGSLRFIRAVPMEWYPDCTRTITGAFSDRMHLLGMTGRGGQA